jgi:predicted TIM-barrel fold metal-dependent hydrolase
VGAFLHISHPKQAFKRAGGVCYSAGVTSTLHRREFLRRLSAGTVIAAGGGAAGNSAGTPRSDLGPARRELAAQRKYDAHAHLGFGPGLRLPVAKLLHAADALGIGRLAVSIPSGPSPELVSAANDTVLRAMKEHPDRLIGQCCVNPHHGAAALEEVKRCLGEGMAGLGELYSYARADDPVFFPLVEYCIAQRASLMWHARADLALVRPGRASAAARTTTTAADLVALARRYPEATLIHGHLGGGGDWEHVCKTLRAVPSVFLDTSGSVSEDGMIDFAVQTLGAERLLFATDMNFETGVGKILAATLTPDQREAIFWRNFDGILRRRGLHAH